MLGGSPANVAYHAALLGASAALVSRVGADALGRRATEQLHAAGVDTRWLQTDPLLPTGMVQVDFQDQQPVYRIAAPSAWDAIAFSPESVPRGAASVFCFGTLAARSRASRETLTRFLQVLDRLPLTERPWRLLDLNLRPPYADLSVVQNILRSAEIVKLNDEELHCLEQQLGRGNGLSYLLERHRLRWVIITHGAAGATLYGHSLRVHCAATPACAGDTVGAGDAFVAAFAVQLTRGKRPPEALHAANRYAGWVAGERGAMPQRNARTPVL